MQAAATLRPSSAGREGPSNACAASSGRGSTKLSSKALRSVRGLHYRESMRMVMMQKNGLEQHKAFSSFKMPCSRGLYPPRPRPSSLRLGGSRSPEQSEGSGARAGPGKVGKQLTAFEPVYALAACLIVVLYRRPLLVLKSDLLLLGLSSCSIDLSARCNCGAGPKLGRDLARSSRRMQLVGVHHVYLQPQSPKYFIHILLIPRH